MSGGEFHTPYQVPSQFSQVGPVLPDPMPLWRSPKVPKSLMHSFSRNSLSATSTTLLPAPAFLTAAGEYVCTVLILQVSVLGKQEAELG